MRPTRMVWLIAMLVVFMSTSLFAGGERGAFGFGVHGGLSRFMADIENPGYSLFGSGFVSYNLNEFIALGLESGYSSLRNNDSTWFRAQLIPAEITMRFNLFPLNSATPYVVLGVGGTFWWSKRDGKTIYRDLNDQNGFAPSLKTGGGMELMLDKRNSVGFDIGFNYRYIFSESPDQIFEGDFDDQVIEVYLGVSYYLNPVDKNDQDKDGVPGYLDLSRLIPEDPDGYLDHDGKPDDRPEDRFAQMLEMLADTLQQGTDTIPPVVLHMPVRKVEAGQRISINAEVLENKALKMVSLLYRQKGVEQWEIETMLSSGGGKYHAYIPSTRVAAPSIEYCIVAVDEAVSGVGYSGLPKRPNVVKVIPNSKRWRRLGSVAALLGWGAAGYLALQGE